MSSEPSLVGRMCRAAERSRFGILTVGLAYVVGVVTGLAMVHTGSSFALGYRDRLVGRAVADSPVLKALRRGRPWQAAVLDAVGNSTAGAGSIVGGYCVPVPYAVALFRGWVGGIVGVDGRHRSRLAQAHSAFYYLVTLILQLLPYTLAGGAGVNIGLAAFGHTAYSGERWLGVPREALRDALRIYLVAVPLFLAASMFEFLCR